MLVCSMRNVINFIPNALTLCNLLCGVLGIYLCFHEALPWAAVMIFIGGFFDFFDGMVARLIGAHSELGKQLDSLADLITFGTLPGLILFNLILAAQGHYYSNFNNIPFNDFAFAGIALFLPLFAALRLAKFNIDETQVNHFMGIPTPAAAIFIAGLPIALEWQYYLNLYIPHDVGEFVTLSKLYYWNNTDIGIMLFFTNQWFYFSTAIVLCMLMVLPVPILAFKFKGLSWANNKWKYVFLIVAVCSIGFAFIHDFIYIKNIPYIQWLIIPILIAELVVYSLIKNILTKSPSNKI